MHRCNSWTADTPASTSLHDSISFASLRFAQGAAVTLKVLGHFVPSAADGGRLCYSNLSCGV